MVVLNSVDEEVEVAGLISVDDALEVESGARGGAVPVAMPEELGIFV